MQAVVLKVPWAVAVFGALVLLFRGLLAGIYFEPTAEAVADAQLGREFVGISCCVLVAAAGYAVLVASWPWWVAVGLVTPVVLCGGLTWVASETLFPQLAVVVAYPAALAAGVAGLVLGPASG
ncbi:hypothetical protein KRR39_10610 [Nocardioides panacis]|uniref:Uncharacterized protein n=1 Tax=Nocardioides panacis TaxID=2849501 RepID=A0A975T273_9ACTN|nr:hypothetical protein [Nocardioides panacis]QWZ10141.1 hypothetical protein KRR39_10610 [Nocardioides panacis]